MYDSIATWAATCKQHQKFPLLYGRGTTIEPPTKLQPASITLLDRALHFTAYLARGILLELLPMCKLLCCFCLRADFSHLAAYVWHFSILLLFRIILVIFVLL